MGECTQMPRTEAKRDALKSDTHDDGWEILPFNTIGFSRFWVSLDFVIVHERVARESIIID